MLMVMSGHARQLRGNLDFSSLGINKPAVVAATGQVNTRFSTHGLAVIDWWPTAVVFPFKLKGLTPSRHDWFHTNRPACTCVCVRACVRAFQWHSARARVNVCVCMSECLSLRGTAASFSWKLTDKILSLKWRCKLCLCTPSFARH